MADDDDDEEEEEEDEEDGWHEAAPAWLLKSCEKPASHFKDDSLPPPFVLTLLFVRREKAATLLNV